MEPKNDTQPKKYKNADGVIVYVHNGKPHNWDGPAYIYPDGTEEYYINGVKMSKEDWKYAIKHKSGLPFYKQTGFKSRF